MSHAAASPPAMPFAIASSSELAGPSTWRAGARLAAVVTRIIIPASIAFLPHGTAASSPEPGPGAERRAQLVRLVRQDCGSCHGLTLGGGLGPALLPDTLAGKPPAGLKATILHGRPGTAMPPWSRFLNEAEAEWIVTSLQKGFPDER